MTHDEEMSLLLRLKRPGICGAFGRLHGMTIGTVVSRLRSGYHEQPGPVAKARVWKLLPGVERHVRMRRVALETWEARRERLRAVLNEMPHGGVKGLRDVPRLRDVAREAGLDYQTVVNFKNGRPFSEANIQRVERALRRLADKSKEPNSKLKGEHDA